MEHSHCPAKSPPHNKISTEHSIPTQFSRNNVRLFLVRVPNLYFGSIQYSWGTWLVAVPLQRVWNSHLPATELEISPKNEKPCIKCIPCTCTHYDYRHCIEPSPSNLSLNVSQKLDLNFKNVILNMCFCTRSAKFYVWSSAILLKAAVGSVIGLAHC